MNEENTPWVSAPPRLLDQVRDEIRRRRYGCPTEQTYLHRKDCISVFDSRLPREMPRARLCAP